MADNWKKVLIPPDKTIKEALDIIDREALRVALVINEKQELLGIVADGDIRRGILSGYSVNETVDKVMTTEPVVANSLVSKKELVKLMQQFELLSIPIVDDNKVIGLQTLQTALKKEKIDNPVFIMAGGFGTRLRPYTDNCPKPMLYIGNKPILEVLIKQFISHGYHRFFISTHYLANMIEEYFGDGSQLGVDIKYVHEEEPLGTGGALGLLPEEALSLPIIVINGDILTKVDFNKLLLYHERHDAIATMCVREYEYQVPFGVIEGNGDYINEITEKPMHHFLINAGVYVVDPRLCSKMNKNQYIDMPNLIKDSISDGEKVSKFPIHEYWLDVGRVDDFNRAQKDIYMLGLG